MRTKPTKPHRDFPLYAHASGQWAKKIRQHVHYFGAWADPQAALQVYLRQKDDLLAGRTPSNGDGLTIKALANSFLNSKKRLVECGEIRKSTFQDYHDTCKRIVKVFGSNALVSSLRPLDFEKLRSDFARTHGPVTLCGDIACTRVLFRYAEDNFGRHARACKESPSTTDRACDGRGVHLQARRGNRFQISRLCRCSRSFDARGKE